MRNSLIAMLLCLVLATVCSAQSVRVIVGGRGYYGGGHYMGYSYGGYSRPYYPMYYGNCGPYCDPQMASYYGYPIATIGSHIWTPGTSSQAQNKKAEASARTKLTKAFSDCMKRNQKTIKNEQVRLSTCKQLVSTKVED